MKKCIPFLLIFLAIASNANAQVQPTDTDGDGYINISTLNHLRWVSENKSSWASNFELDNNINAAPTDSWNAKAGFSPIGDSLTSFIGKFEGNGFAIDSLCIKRATTNFVGFFGGTSGAEISNVGITNCYIIGRANVGGLVGVNMKASIVSNSFSTGNVFGTNCVGGLVGINYKTSTVINSYSRCNVLGDRYLGGLIGDNFYSSVINSYSIGNVSGNSSVGGFVGDNYYSSVINSYSIGNVSGNSSVGGLVGDNHYSSAINSFWDIQTSGIDSSAGGIGKTTSDLKTKLTFTSSRWNFDLVWSIEAAVNSGYPFINDRGITLSGIEPIDTDGNGYKNISCYSHLHWICRNVKSWVWNYELDNDINADTTRLISGDMGFAPIGNNNTYYIGKFNGNGYAIGSMFINRPATDFVGLFGKTNGSDISNLGMTNCQIIGRDFVGMLIGLDSASTVSKVYAAGSISGRDYIGGVVGENSSSSITNSYNIGSVSGQDCIGGLIGKNSYNSTVSLSYNRGNITGTNVSAGGLVGWNMYNSSISLCYNKGQVSGLYSVGGLVGENTNSEVINIYNCGSVAGSIYVGGIVGFNYSATVHNGYNVNSVTGKDSVGGIVGENYYATVKNSFWDIQTSKISTSDGGTGKTTTEMKTKSTFTSAGWDFEKIWAIDPNYNDGYPNLEGKNGHSGIMAQSSESYIYPQPATDELFVKLSETTDATAFIRIYDQTGQLALTSETSASDGLIRLNTSAISSGVYQMIIRIAGKNYTEKVVIVK